MKNSIFGIDGCKKGWVVASLKDNQINVSYTPLNKLVFTKKSYLVIDIPIFLPNCLQDYPRKDEIKAKKTLKNRHGSLFYSPCKKWLDQSLEEINTECSISKKPKLSKQSFNLFRHIQDIQQVKKSHPYIFESHPELFFLQRYNIALPKKNILGINQRYKALQTEFEQLKITLPPLNTLATMTNESLVSNNDIIDALAMLLVGIFYSNNNYLSCGSLLY